MLKAGLPRARLLLTGAFALVLLSGCAPPDARTGAAAGQPISPPGRATTPYTQALTCLSDQLAAQLPVLREPVILGAGTLPDATGRVSPGLRDMVTTAMVRGTRASRVFVVTESLSLGQLPGSSIGGPVTTGGTIIRPGAMPTHPNAVQIYGALTQADRNVQGQEIRAGAGTTTNVLGISQNADIANVGIDLHLARVSTGELLQSVSNQMTVRNLSRGANADFNIRGMGLNFSVSFDEREGLHQAVRTLVELSVLELIGLQARLPYWHCFQINRSNPVVQRQIATWFRELTPEQLDSYVRTRLRVLGYAVPDAPASMMPALQSFQRGQNLVPSGQPTFETFAALVDGMLAAGPPGPTPAALPPASPPTPRRLQLNVLQLAIPQPLLQLSIQPDRAGLAVCYYRDDTGAVWRLLPNPYRNDQGVAGDQPLQVPRAMEDSPAIQPSRMTPDVGFLCAVGSQDWSTLLPAEAWGADMSRLPGMSFATLREAFGRGGADVAITETTRGRPSGRWSVIQPPN